MKTFSVRTATLSVCLGALMSTAPALAAPLDLNEFFADPTVVRTADGSMATLFEDPEFRTVILELDPGLGDPNLIIPRVGSFLLFTFDFVEPDSGNNDMFVAYLLDATTGLSFGGMFEFATDLTEAGTLEFDLGSFVGQVIGLHIALVAASDDVGLNSSVKISNLRLETVDEPPAIPEGSTATLLLSGLAAIGFYRRRMRA